MELDPGGPNTDSARLAYRRKHIECHFMMDLLLLSLM